jgi:L-ascorbate metabolism protein UlaG (beta-lactamase superfamily)
MKMNSKSGGEIMDRLSDILNRLRWLGHSSFRLDGTPTIYFDPWQLASNSPPADLILVTHEHHDHCSPEDVATIRLPTTVIIANPSAAKKLGAPVTVLHPGERTDAAGVEIAAVPAYNIDKRFHPRDAKHVGFVVNVDGVRIYHTGDTDHIPEMADIDCDIALLPVSGTYVMTADEAVAAARDLQPEVVVPMHYGAGVVGTEADARHFEALWEGNTLVLSKTT